MTKNLIINQFNSISMFDFSSNFVSTLTVRIPHCYVTLLLSKFLGGSCQEYTEAWWKIYILIVVLRSSSPPHGGGCFHHGKKEVGGCLLCEKLTMHSWLKIEKSEINRLPQSLKIILNFYFKHWLIAFYDANSGTFPKFCKYFSDFRTLCIVKSWQYDDDYDDARTGVYWRLLRNIQVLMLINQKAKGKIPEDNQEFLLEMKTNGL